MDQSPASEPSSPPSLCLAIETSGRDGGVALVTCPPKAEQGLAEPVSVRLLDTRQRAARALLPAINSLLREAGIGPTQISGIVVTRGPGSFTGLRIGVTVAKTLAYSLGKPLVGLDTLEVLARGVEGVGGLRVWSVMDAQRGELFVACRRLPLEEGEEPLVPTQVVPLAKWLGMLAPGDVIARPTPMPWETQLPDGVVLPTPVSAETLAVWAGRLGCKRLAAGVVIDPFELTPHYFRASAAEEKRALKLS